jgi:hypothetical protein
MSPTAIPGNLILQSPSNSIWKITSDQVNPPGDAAITYDITNAGGVFNLRSAGTVDYEIEWGDGAVEISTLNTLPHTYTAGNYTLDVYSDGVYRPYFNNVGADASQITSVVIGPGANLGTDITNAWYGANNMTDFNAAFGVTAGVTIFTFTWFNCSSLTSFPLIDTSSGTSFTYTWFICSSLTSFPLIDTSSGADFSAAWYGCTSLTSFPLIDTSGARLFFSAWYNCASLANFPANMFDTTGTLVSNAFDQAWFGCALTAQSIENILVSLDTNGATGITLNINGGTNANTSTWSAAANAAWLSLDAKGWDITQNGPDPT